MHFTKFTLPRIILYPLAQLALGKEGELQIELNLNPRKLVDVLDWKDKPGVN